MKTNNVVATIIKYFTTVATVYPDGFYLVTNEYPVIEIIACKWI